MNKSELRVWWIPQVPMKPFHVPVDSVKEAKKILQVLADYDIFQFENNIKPDYCNAGGLEKIEFSMGAEWDEWENEDGDNIDDVDENGAPL